MPSTYTRTLPNLTQATRSQVYERLSSLLSHLEHLNTDLLSVSIDVPTRVVTAVLTNPIDLDQRNHFGLD